MDNEPESLQKAATDLRDAVRALQATVQEANNVRSELDTLLESSSTNRKLIRIVAVAAVVNLVIIVTIIVIGFNLNAVIQRQQNIMQVQRDSALCPLYGILLEGNTPEAREAWIRNGRDVVYRDKAFRVIRQSYEALGCKQEIEDD